MFKLTYFRRIALIGALVLGACAAHAAAETQSADKLLVASDLARGGGLKGIRLYSSVTDFKGDKAGTELKLEIQGAGDDSLVNFVDPPRVRGNKILIQGRNMWFASPDVKKPVAISPRQRMLGEATNGDIATTRYGRDYNATLTGEEVIDGRSCWVLDLRAKGTSVAYDRIRYFIDKQSQLGVKAEFFSVSGDVLKMARMEYDNKVADQGHTVRFVSRMEISDALEPSKRTVLKYWDIRTDEITSAAFSLANLTRN
jgi:hypothetical protein